MNWGYVAALAVGVAAGVALRWWWPDRVHDARRTVVDPPVDQPSAGEPMPLNFAQSSLNALNVGVLVLDNDDVPALANPAARAMGLLRARAGGQSGAVAHTIVRTLAGQVRRSGVSREVELDVPRPGGEGEPLGVHVRAVDIGGGYVAVEAADVTEAHRVNRVRRDFVANVSHELKTPVGALQLLGEALHEALDEDATDVDAGRRFAARILHESGRLARLISELLELSRLQGAEPLPEPEPCPVDRIIAEAVDRTRTPAAAKNIEVAVTGTRGLTVYGNESQLVTAVASLVENAVAYSSDGTRVEITAGNGADTVQIAVRDEGIGIEPRDLDRIFERFYRADRARSRATGGTGLGLAIVKHILTNHGGRVEVVSTVGEGSTFTLRLPARSLDMGGRPPASVGIDPDPGDTGA
ncbi:two-component sensor histidine kinase [Virgisporangium aliadipatigenens]|uniref:Sensor-like histidine kinase SenX3 n=1 Tax=Virgisporangium aliadipatigenens TaxID=741659 RepID=A0A8J3YNS7_9ACTN|nr:ATP-binding protein [Virgisporangium aliadipatigenens]GIJ48601.1 two-component sensor histidine kinase [Virgisporangium aliadipatigenens]